MTKLCSTIVVCVCVEGPSNFYKEIVRISQVLCFCQTKGDSTDSTLTYLLRTTQSRQKGRQMAI